MAGTLLLWCDPNTGLVHLGPEEINDDDLLAFTLCSEEDFLIATWWLNKVEDPKIAPTCLRCIGAENR